jgi:hypothetical protein
MRDVLYKYDAMRLFNTNLRWYRKGLEFQNKIPCDDECSNILHPFSPYSSSSILRGCGNSANRRCKLPNRRHHPRRTLCIRTPRQRHARWRRKWHAWYRRRTKPSRPHRWWPSKRHATHLKWWCPSFKRVIIIRKLECTSKCERKACWSERIAGLGNSIAFPVLGQGVDN